MTERRDLLASLLPIAKSLRKIEERAAAEHGVSMWQYAALALIVDSPGLSQRQAADRMDYSRNRIIGDLDHLEKCGFLLRQAGADRRANLLHATSRGTAVMRQVRSQIHVGEDVILAELSIADRHDFQRLVRRIGTLVAH